MTRVRRKILIIGGVPTEAGGRGNDGLSYSVWNNTRHLSCKEYNIAILADNVLPQHMRFGEVQQAELTIPSARRLYKQLLVAVRACKRPYLRSLNAIGKCAWYADTIASYKPDLIHVHGALRACMVATSGLATPLVVSLHGSMNSSFGRPYPFLLEIEHEALKVASALVTVTERTYKKIDRYAIYCGLRCVIPDGIDYDLMYRDCQPIRIESAKTVLLTVGSLTDNKNQKLVIRAISESASRNTFHYITIGSGPLRLELEAEATSLGVSYENIPSVPYRRLRYYYSSAAAHILISHSEGFGMCIAESLACGTPVIIAKNMDICGQRDIINQKNSIQVDDYASNELANVLDRLAKKELGFYEASLTYPYSWHDVANKYLSLYRKLLE